MRIASVGTAFPPHRYPQAEITEALIDRMADQQPLHGIMNRLHSNCGVGTQLLISSNSDAERDALRAFEIPDRDPISTGSAVDFDGRLTALWPESSGTSAIAVVKRKDAELYEAYRLSISCSN